MLVVLEALLEPIKELVVLILFLAQQHPRAVAVAVQAQVVLVQMEVLVVALEGVLQLLVEQELQDKEIMVAILAVVEIGVALEAAVLLRLVHQLPVLTEVTVVRELHHPLRVRL